MDFVVLNGGSSAGKTSIARCLQDRLMPDPWLTFAVDDLITALPPSAIGHESVITFNPDGIVGIGPTFDRLEANWIDGLTAMARAGTGIILDELFLDGRTSQRRLRSRLAGLDILWVGVHCDPEVARVRAATRPNRNADTAASRAYAVHAGVTYEIDVDTTEMGSGVCADLVAERIAAGPGS